MEVIVKCRSCNSNISVLYYREQKDCGFIVLCDKGKFIFLGSDFTDKPKKKK